MTAAHQATYRARHPGRERANSTAYRRRHGIPVRKRGYDHNQYSRDWRNSHPGYSSWLGMKTRCYNPSHNKFHLYGGRGVKVCERWRTSFANFIADMGPRPSPAHSIDRYPNKDGDYKKSNCRWATPEQQNNNRRARAA
jgi:hypothetical protein